MRRNRHHGFSCSAQATPDVWYCTFRGGESAGVHVGRQGGGSFIGCQMTGNQEAGIALEEPQEPSFEDCIIRGPGKAGIQSQGAKGGHEYYPALIERSWIEGPA